MLLSNAFDPDPRVHREAVALIDHGYSVKLLCWDRDLTTPSRETVDGIDVQRVYVKSTHGRGITQMFYLFCFWMKAFFSALSIDCHLIHAHDFDTLPLGYALSKVKRAKLVYDSHESYLDMVHHLPGPIKKAILFTENFIIKRVSLLITVGELLRSHFADRGARNTRVVGNWQDPEQFEFSNDVLREKRRELGIGRDQIVIVFIANLGLERQLPQLIGAVSQCPWIFLILGGDGFFRKIAEKAAKQYENIVYLGFVEPPIVPLYTALSDMVYYGFDPENPNARFSAPNKLFEALAAGKAIITADFGEIGKIVRANRCGIILPRYDTEEILKTFEAINKMFMNKISNNAKAAGRVFLWRKAAHVLIRAYDSLS